MPPPSANNLVLLVDDTPDNLKMLSEALDHAGYMVIVATDGHSALERLDFVVPDIVLLDAVMPGMDGFETCRRIKAHPTAGHVPVVFMTGLTEPEDVVRGFQAGGIDYVVKPLDTNVVLARLQAHLRNARMMSVAINAMDAVANAVVVLDDAGGVTWKTAKARLWLAEFFGEDDGDDLPAPLSAWVAQHLASAATSAGGATAVAAPAFLRRGGERELRIRLTASRKAGEHVLLMDERCAPPAPASSLATAYQLTAREHEVLLWLAKGKTNRDISDILGMSPRTVNKHLEHVYVKLGVETRAAATALVLTHMHGQA
ncbi:DNA-binding response regulator [Bordetella sputigena]|uniref:response regulator n=1 Tax=Bordetella sputigena TaxID=1416810 RepID=UPI0039EE22AB